MVIDDIDDNDERASRRSALSQQFYLSYDDWSDKFIKLLTLEYVRQVLFI